MYEQMEIVLIPFPYSDLSLSKKRPALIISNEKINKMQDRICCLITTKPHKDNLKIEKSFIKEGNLPFQSFIKPHRIFTINENIMIKKLCKINNNLHKLVIKKIHEYLE
ncbi:MAG TPA: type II toxin-antitoxin system PemK/MazF family toxin [Candidatus Nanoarchaeia archaeon]|nr:type II toxin-antitoxin system PemK/MazF family toxin [Candidatus Nanoarchaeia archaeon]